jgi:DNA-binding XRE family transcriptional regulator
MTIPYEQVFESFSPEDQVWIKERASEILSDISLRQLRKMRTLTQTRLSKKLKIGQEGVSRIEKRTDLYLSTLRSYVEGVGGELILMAKFPDRAPVILKGFGTEDEPKSRKKTPSRKAKTKPKARRAA